MIAGTNLGASRTWAWPAIATLAVLAVFSAGAASDSLVYAAPVAIAVAVSVVATLFRAALGQAWATGATLAFVLFVLNLNFRVREIGDVGLDLQNGVKLGAWVALFCIALARRDAIRGMFRDPVLGLAAAYAVVAFASAAWSPVPTYTAANAFGLVAYLCLAAVTAVDLGTVAALRVTLASLSALMAVSLLGGALVPDLAYSAPSDVETVYRLQGFSGHPNVLGQQAVVLCLAAVASLRLRAICWRGFLPALALGLFTVIETRSRFALAAFLLSWAYIALRGRGAIPLLALGGMALITLATGLAAVMPLPDPDALFGEISRTGSSHEILTLTGRTELWEAAAVRIAERPLFGWGFNGTEGLLAEGLPGSFTGSSVNAHNMFVQTLLSVGFVGSLPAFGFLGILLIRAFACPESLSDQVTVFVLLNGMGEVEIFGTPVLLTLFAYWAIARRAETRHRPSPRPRRTVRHA